MQTTKLHLEDKLPLTCSRTGTCCHGKLVQLNPWELRCLALEKKISVREFRDTFCDFGGIRLRFDGKAGWKGYAACSQYIENFGCSVHIGRPLSCRLYPLGRQIQSEEVHYMYQSSDFPCIEGCPEVNNLPQLSVKEYLSGQATELFEQAQDAYLELMQNLADMSFMLLLETGLAQSGDKKTLRSWRKMGKEQAELLAQQIGTEWLDALMLPEIACDEINPTNFASTHANLLQQKIDEQFASLQSNEAFHQASVLLMALALHLARGLGANPEALALHWVETAKSHGAKE